MLTMMLNQMLNDLNENKDILVDMCSKCQYILCWTHFRPTCVSNEPISQDAAYCIRSILSCNMTNMIKLFSLTSFVSQSITRKITINVSVLTYWNTSSVSYACVLLWLLDFLHTRTLLMVHFDFSRLYLPLPCSWRQLFLKEEWH